jgi:hypothetical protein
MSDIYGRPSAPTEEHETIFVEEVICGSAWGSFIPQYFVNNTEKLSCVPDWAWDTCKNGPILNKDAADYWDAWSEILETFEYKKTGPGGSTERYFLDYEEGDLCLMREILEPATYDKS